MKGQLFVITKQAPSTDDNCDVAKWLGLWLGLWHFCFLLCLTWFLQATIMCSGSGMTLLSWATSVSVSGPGRR